jgi:ATP-dependent DNA helicase RecQ
LSDVPVLALTATATPEVVDDIQDKLLFKKKNVFQKSFERKNIAYVVRKTEDKFFEMVNILNKVDGSGIVYVRSRKKTRELSQELVNRGIDADFFHAGLSPEEKAGKQNQWKSGECRIIVCTNAFGMGIDKPDVRIVIHFEMPGSLEEYFQEAGRAGRDEQKAYAVALYSENDIGKLKKRIKDEFPERDYIKDVYEKLAYYFQIGINSGFQATYNFDHEQFCTTFKYSFTQVRYALKLLQLSGYIEFVEDMDKQSRLIFTINRDDLYGYSDFDAKTDRLVRTLLRSYTGLFAEYVYISESLLATRSGLAQHEVYEILKMLSSQRIIHFIPARKMPAITYTRSREDINYISIPKIVYEDRKDRLSARIGNVVEYVSLKKICRNKLLLNYFGEKQARDCGCCDVCLDKQRNGLNNYAYNKVASEILEYLEKGSCKLNILAGNFSFPEEIVIEVIRSLADTGKIMISGDLIGKRCD